MFWQTPWFEIICNRIYQLPRWAIVFNFGNKILFTFTLVKKEFPSLVTSPAGMDKHPESRLIKIFTLLNFWSPISMKLHIFMSIKPMVFGQKLMVWSGKANFRNCLPLFWPYKSFQMIFWFVFKNIWQTQKHPPIPIPSWPNYCAVKIPGQLKQLYYLNYPKAVFLIWMVAGLKKENCEEPECFA